MSAPHTIVIVAGVWLIASLTCALWWWQEIRHTIGARCNCGQFPLDVDEAMWTTTLLHRPDVCQPHSEAIR